MLRDFKTGKEIKLPKLHGNRKVRCFISGQMRTVGSWKRASKEAAERLIKGFKDSEYQFL